MAESCLPKDLRQFKKFFRTIGGQVEEIDGTGEERFWHPSMDRTIRVNARRKDVPRSLTVYAKRILDGGE